MPTIGVAAREIGVHERTLKTWLKAGCPGRAGHYDVAAIVEWHETHVGGSIGDADSSEMQLWKVEKLKAEAQQAQLKLERARGRLVSREEVERDAAELVLRLRERFETMPDDLQMEFPAKVRAQWKQRLESRIRLMLTELASWGERMEGDGKQTAADEPGKKPK